MPLCAPAAETAVQQHQEVAGLLGNLVGHDGERRDGPEVRIRSKGGADNQSIHEIVHAVADHDHGTGAPAAMRMPVILRVIVSMIMTMIVSPQHHPLQHEEQQDAGEHDAQDGLRRLAETERVWKDLQEHGAQQRTDGVAHQARNPMGPGRQRDDADAGERQDAGGGGGREGSQEDGHVDLT